MFKWAKKLRFVFPKHVWTTDGDRRTCSCGRIEEYDQGDGFCGPMWLPVEDGDPSKHL